MCVECLLVGENVAVATINTFRCMPYIKAMAIKKFKKALDIKSSDREVEKVILKMVELKKNINLTDKNNGKEI